MRKRVRAARGYGGPREWVLTATLADAARGPGTRRREIEGLWVVRCFIEATLEHSQAPGAYVQACALLPPPSPLFQRKYRAHRHCPRSIPGAKPANNLPEQGLTLLTQPKL